jgi:hypothetical protein
MLGGVAAARPYAARAQQPIRTGSGRELVRNCRGEAADMVARPYAIHSDSECDRLEKQAVLAGLENHLRHVPVPKTARILDAGCAQARWHAALPHTLRTRQ